VVVAPGDGNDVGLSADAFPWLLHKSIGSRVVRRAVESSDVDISAKSCNVGVGGAASPSTSGGSMLDTFDECRFD
jgi:hypothetical protein